MRFSPYGIPDTGVYHDPFKAPSKKGAKKLQKLRSKHFVISCSKCKSTGITLYKHGDGYICRRCKL